MTHDPPELDQLLAGLCDDDLSAAERARLAALLRNDVAARARYLEWVDLHACLAQEMENRTALATAEALARGTPAPAAATRAEPAARRSLAWVGLALAASLFVAAFFLSGRGERPLRTPELGVIATAQQLEWGDPSLPISAGDKIFPGHYLLRAGQVQFHLKNGVEITVHAPANMSLVDAKTLQLTEGRLVARVPEAAIGFRVTTPNTDVVDLGTEFGVSVEENGSTEIHVAEGVVVARSSSSSGVVPIVGREAGRVDFELREVSPIPFDSSRFPGFSAAPAPAAFSHPSNHEPMPRDARIVFLGDEAISQETSLLLVSRAFADAGFPVRPRLYNAGLTFEMLFSEENYERYVGRFRPTHAFIVFGPEIARHSNEYMMPPERFRDAITKMVDRLEQDGVQPIVATGFPLGQQHPDGQQRLDEYNRFLRALAAERGYRLADLEAAFLASSSRLDLLARNGFEPSFDGHRLMAQSFLAVMGWPELRAPMTLDLSPLPGILTEWQVLGWPREQPLDAAAVAALSPDARWQTVHLPQSIDRYSQRLPHPSHSDIARDRLRGFATHLVRLGRERTVGLARLPSAAEREAVLNVGGTIQSVWLNGEHVFDVTRGPTRGRHAGFERLPIRLQAGENTIIVDAKVSFFVSVTDTFDWPVP